MTNTRRMWWAASGVGGAPPAGDTYTAWTWGTNNYGQLGDSTTVGKSSPVQAGSATDWVQFAVGGTGTFANSSAAINDAGELWTWGDNYHGVWD